MFFLQEPFLDNKTKQTSMGTAATTDCCYRPKEDTVSESNQVFVIYHPNGRTARFSLRFKRQV
ncbi:hypothetical protein COOONC_28538 [Cooperia oncophora]